MFCTTQNKLPQFLKICITKILTWLTGGFHKLTHECDCKKREIKEEKANAQTGFELFIDTTAHMDLEHLLACFWSFIII